MNKEALARLKERWPDEELSSVVIAENEERKDTGYQNWVFVKAYLPESLIQERLDEVDPAWEFEIISLEETSIPNRRRRTSDKQPVSTQGVAALARMRVLGVARMGAGTDPDARAAATYAFKSCAEKFGIGRFLDLDPRYTLRFCLRDEVLTKSLRYGRLSWSEVIAIAQKQGAKIQPKPAPEAPRSQEETPAIPKPGPELITATTGGQPWHAGLRKAIQARGLTEEQVLDLAYRKKITQGAALRIEELSLDETNAVLKLLASLQAK